MTEQKYLHWFAVTANFGKAGNRMIGAMCIASPSATYVNDSANRLAAIALYYDPRDTNLDGKVGLFEKISTHVAEEFDKPFKETFFNKVTGDAGGTDKQQKNTNTIGYVYKSFINAFRNEVTSKSCRFNKEELDSLLLKNKQQFPVNKTRGHELIYNEDFEIFLKGHKLVL